MKIFFKKYKIELLAFTIPILIFLFACVIAKVWPFGQNYIAAYDGSAQYPGFTTYLTRVLRGQDSLFYSFKGGLGFNFYATAIYYLFNPTNLLSVFFNKNSIMLFYTLIVFLRIGLSGLTMSIYLKNKEKMCNGRLMFSIAYALMAYNVVYFYNFMYFDTVVLLPLVILGLERLIKGKSPVLYIVFLTLTIISNYYIGSMVCIFSLLYFIYSYIIMDKSKRKKKIILTFIISSLLSGIMCTFAILPEFFELMNGKASLYGDSYTVYNEWGMDFFASFYRLTIGSYKVGEQANGYPNIFCSILVLIYTILFFFNKKYSRKEKIATSIFIAFFLLCFSFNLLDYAWQFFQKPVWYPNRYSFVFSFLLITIAYKCFNNKEKIEIKNWLTYLLTFLLILLVAGAAWLCEVHNADTSKLIFLLLSFICIIEYMLTAKLTILKYLIITIFIIEVGANTISSVKQVSYAKKVDAYNETFNELNDSFTYMHSLESDKNNFYRADANNWININNGGTYDYNAMIYFNSLRNGKMMYFLEHYGGYTAQDMCSIRFNGKNPILTSLLSFKYLVSNSKEYYYELINDDLKYKLYRNNDSLSLGVMMNSKIKDAILQDKDMWNNSDKILNYSLGKKSSSFKELNYNSVDRYWEGYEEDKKYVYYNSEVGGYIYYEGTFEENGFLLLNDSLKNNHSVELKINDDKAITSFNIRNFSPYYVNKGDKYQIKVYLSSDKILASDLILYLLDFNDYANWINEMKENELVITDYKKDNYIKGTINVTSDKKTMFTSIPYDKGWKVFVDGKKIKYEELLTAFIGFDLKPGKHIIEFRFIPRGFIIGIVISCISLLSSVIFIKKFKRKKTSK